MSLVNVVAIITTKPGLRDKVLDKFKANTTAVLAEDGCIEYAANVDVNVLGKYQENFGEETFVVIEKWASADALRAHAASPHMVAYGKATKDMIADRKIHVVEVA